MIPELPCTDQGEKFLLLLKKCEECEGRIGEEFMKQVT